MNKRIIIAIVGSIVGIGVLGYLLVQNSKPSPSPVPQNTSQQPAPQTNAPADTAIPTNAVSLPGKYADYSDTVIASTTGTKLLFFHAKWCTQCLALEKDILAKGLPSNLTIIKVDYDTNQKLRQKYGVTLQTTFVKVDDNGNLVQKYIAYDQPNLDAVIKNLL